MGAPPPPPSPWSRRPCGSRSRRTRAPFPPDLAKHLRARRFNEYNLEAIKSHDASKRIQPKPDATDLQLLDELAFAGADGFLTAVVHDPYPNDHRARKDLSPALLARRNFNSHQRTPLKIAVDLGFHIAAQVLFRGVVHKMTRDNDWIKGITQIANTDYIAYEPEEFFYESITRFPEVPGEALLDVMNITVGACYARLASATRASEVNQQYAEMARQGERLLMALVETLSQEDVYELLVETRVGGELLDTLTCNPIAGMGEFLSFEPVYAIIDKRWNGRYTRTLTSRRNIDGSVIEPSKILALQVLLILVVIPANVFYVFLTVVYPPLGTLVHNRLSALGKGVGGDIGPIKKLLGISLPWKSLLLLDTPLYRFYTDFLCQSALLVCLIVYPAAESTMELKLFLLLWAFLSLFAELQEAMTHYSRWSSDWLNLLDIPALAFATLGTAYDVFNQLALVPTPEDGELDASITGMTRNFFIVHAAQFQGALRFVGLARAKHVAVAMLFCALGFRRMLLNKTIGPMVQILRDMIQDVVLWGFVTAVFLFAFGLSFGMLFRDDNFDEAADDCNAAIFTVSLVRHFPQLLVTLLGGGEEYVICALRSLEPPRLRRNGCNGRNECNGCSLEPPRPDSARNGRRVESSRCALRGRFQERARGPDRVCHDDVRLARLARKRAFSRCCCSLPASPPARPPTTCLPCSCTTGSAIARAGATSSSLP